jgi:mercuric ion transport protein
MLQHWEKIRIGVSGLIALVSCPCHLPITLPIILAITAGTSLGVWIANNTSMVLAISTVIFISSLLFTLRWSSAASEPGNCKLTDAAIKQPQKKSVG